jgi:hypothetical protein
MERVVGKAGQRPSKVLRPSHLRHIAGAGQAVVGVVAKNTDGTEAHHKDQGQHYGVLDGRWAVFSHQEITGESRNSSH